MDIIRQKYLKDVKVGQLTILVGAILTTINVILIVTRVIPYLIFSSVIDKFLTPSITMLLNLNYNTFYIPLFIEIISLGCYFGFYFLSKKSYVFLSIFTALFIIDTAIIILQFLFMFSVGNFIIGGVIGLTEIVYHVIMLYFLFKAIISQTRLMKLDGLIRK